MALVISPGQELPLLVQPTQLRFAVESGPNKNIGATRLLDHTIRRSSCAHVHDTPPGNG